MLNKEEINRFSRQIQLSEFGVSGQEKLKMAKVVIVGAGGLGGPVIQYLSAAGIGHLGIVDFDLVELSNLHRQVIFTQNDIGKAKVVCAQNWIHAQNPNIQVEIFNLTLSPENAESIFSKFDIVVDCTDNFEARYAINDACVRLNTPFVYAGIHKFEAQLSVFNLDEKSPTYRCAFPERPSNEITINCSITGVLGTTPGILGTMQANEVIKMITGIGEICSGQMLLFNTKNYHIQFLKIKRNTEAIQSRLKMASET